MRALLRPALVCCLVFSVVTGIVYPAVVGGVASLLFPRQASGSAIRGTDGRIAGSRLVGQPFTSGRYLWGRPSATTPAYNAAASSGSNLGPTSAVLDSLVRARVATLRASYTAVGLSAPGDPIPVDLVTASGSGLDPDISPASARWQVARIAAARGVSRERVQAIIDQHTERPWLGVVGDARVHVLAVNLALDAERP
ncbi:MAG: potassium-transporting ATPase subunit KdpC [Gemmatimonadaceae bacterium]|jgi:K+-transporting ATPase ATPase C chain|nr:potassium-transporting ATPase subunit KdpC [Gemmatimonadaceae bacterium]